MYHFHFNQKQIKEIQIMNCVVFSFLLYIYIYLRENSFLTQKKQKNTFVKSYSHNSNNNIMQFIYVLYSNNC